MPFYEAQDHPHDDLCNVGTEHAFHVPYLQRACDSTPGGTAFHIHWWLKKDRAIPWATWGGRDMCVVCLDPIQKLPITERAGPQSLPWVVALRPPPLGVRAMGYAQRPWDMEWT